APVSELNPNLYTSSAVSVMAGTRYVWNLVDSAGGDTGASTTVARSLVGFDFDGTHSGTTTAPLCSGAVASTVQSAGVLDLPQAPPHFTVSGHALTGTASNVTCRHRTDT